MSRNQRLFGAQITVDTGGSVEAGGALKGCELPACLSMTALYPRTYSGNPTTALYYPSVFGNMVTLNNGSGAQCLAVPTRARSWGQLKSLYR